MSTELKRSDILAFWHERGMRSDKSTAPARFHSEHTVYDLTAITALSRPGARILDLGCGDCDVDNRLVSELDVSVHAVDVVPAFLENAIAHPRLTTQAADILGYNDGRRYDLVLLLGVINSFPRPEERLQLYANCRDMLAPGGTLFIKSQFGVAETVTVDHFSAQLGAHYKAVYPALAEEAALLRSLFDVSVEDPYPEALNRHANTRFHYLACTRRT